MTTPRVQFVIGGVQKGGTTALASFLAQHPGIRLPATKEAHVFDDPGFDDAWDAQAVDERYLPHLGAAVGDGIVHGDATPIYCFLPQAVARIARYNPQMRWILILRDPVDRAISQWRMERGRGDESWPLWAAALFEPLRTAGHGNDLALGSPLRHHTYLARGDYARQMDLLLAHFPAAQLLVLRNADLAARPGTVIEQVWRFLGLPAPAAAPVFSRVFEGGHQRLPDASPTRRLLALLLRGRMRAAADRYGLNW